MTVSSGDNDCDQVSFASAKLRRRRFLIFSFPSYGGGIRVHFLYFFYRVFRRGAIFFFRYSGGSSRRYFLPYVYVIVL